ncbi:MAG: hypothetical protein DDT29_01941 [Dehalococcoidia bacterium]|nr:hypothetical protein [Bacillota bacterium]
MMKKVIVLTMIVLTVMATSAMAMLKVLEPALASELEGLVREQLAAERRVSIDKVVIGEGWLLELHNLNTDLYVVIAAVNGEKVETHVHVADKRVLTAEETAALKAANEKAAPAEPIMRIMAADATADKQIAEAAPVANNRPWYLVAGGAGVLMVLSVGAFVFMRKL